MICGFDSPEEAELLQRLYKQGRIHQPRMLSDSYNHGQEEFLFPYDNYRHKAWYSIKDQALTDLEDKPGLIHSRQKQRVVNSNSGSVMPSLVLVTYRLMMCSHDLWEPVVRTSCYHLQLGPGFRFP